MSPELIAQCVQIGMGAVALYVSLRVSARVDRIITGCRQHEARLSRLEKLHGIESAPAFQPMELADGP